MQDDEAIALALAEAKACADRGEVPVGAVLLAADGTLLAQNGNRILEHRDPTAHAKMLVLRAGAQALGNERLGGGPACSSRWSLAPCARARFLWPVWGGWFSRRKTPRAARCFMGHGFSSSRPVITGR